MVSSNTFQHLHLCMLEKMTLHLYKLTPFWRPIKFYSNCSDSLLLVSAIFGNFKGKSIFLSCRWQCGIVNLYCIWHIFIHRFIVPGDFIFGTIIIASFMHNRHNVDIFTYLFSRRVINDELQAMVAVNLFWHLVLLNS